MMTSLSLISPLFDWWHQLRDGTRDGIIAGLVVAIILAVAAIFQKSLLASLRHLLGSGSQAPFQTPPEITVRFEGVRPVESSSQLLPAALIPLPSHIPRPPIAGFVARRDRDGHDIVERLKHELAPEKSQLIVLWGAGGVGKTTLAAETARLLKSAFPGGVLWISAEGRPDFSISTLLDEIATHLGRIDLRQLVLERKDIEVHDALASSSSALIILDNFETVSSEEQDICGTWLAKRANCPALITSRDEVVNARPINILGMSLPEAHELLQILIGQARHQTAFDGLEREEIIKAADRIPLVLQWVVKRIDSSKQPQAVLDDLARGEGDAAKRVFDRSFDLPQVGDDGRGVLLALSQFMPSASRTALAKVAGFGDDTKRLNQAVQQLADLWLIEMSQGNERLSVEGLTRELAKSRLTKEDLADEFRRRFVNYFLTLAESHRQSTAENYDALEIEKDNLIGAMDVALELRDWDSIQAIGSILVPPPGGLLYIHGHWDEAIQRGRQSMEAARLAGNELALAEFAGDVGTILLFRGEHAEARRLYEQALVTFRKLANDSDISTVLHQLAMLAHEQDELDEARQLYDESLEIKKKLNNQEGIARTLHQLGKLARSSGDMREARRFYLESLQIKKKQGDQIGIAITLHALANLALSQGQLNQARQLYNESLEITIRLGDKSNIALIYCNLGMLEEKENNNTEAGRLFNEGLVIFEKLKSPKAEYARQGLERVKGNSS